MPFTSCFKNIFKKSIKDAAEKYGGEEVAGIVDGVVDEGFKQLNIDEQLASIPGGEELGQIVQKFSGSQESGFSSFMSILSGNSDVFWNHCHKLGLDESLVSGIRGMLTGGSGSGEGFKIENLIKAASLLTEGSKSESGSNGLNGFLALITGGGSSSGSVNSIMKILMGLAKSFFKMQMSSNKSMQDWSGAFAKDGNEDKDLDSWGDNVVKDLVFPSKPDKDTIDVDVDPDTSGDDDKVNGWFDRNPTIGKMQKNVFDDIFDTVDKDKDIEDPTPVIPIPKGIEESEFSILNQASVLFLNSKILLDLRKEWRFLYSSNTNEKDFSTFYDRIHLKGPTLIVIKNTDGQVFGAFASTSWIETDGGWVGNGNSFLFSIRPKMAVFYSTGKDDNYMFCSRDQGLGLGGRKDCFGLSINSDMETGSYHEAIDTFDLPPLISESFEISNIEVWGLGEEEDPETLRSSLGIRKPNLTIDSNADYDPILDQIM